MANIRVLDIALPHIAISSWSHLLSASARFLGKSMYYSFIFRPIWVSCWEYKLWYPGVTFLALGSYYGSSLRCSNRGEEWIRCKLLVLSVSNIAGLTFLTIWTRPLQILSGNAGRRECTVHFFLVTVLSFFISFTFLFLHICLLFIACLSWVMDVLICKDAFLLVIAGY